MLKKICFGFIIFVFAFGLTGCVKFGDEKEAQGNPGGVFVSGDKGENWVRKVDKMTAGPIEETIGDVNVITFTFDPSDPKAIYMGTAEDGIYYSYNNGKGWFEVPEISTGFVRGIAVDPEDRCTIYTAVNTRLMKTTNCSRTWEEAYKVPLGQRVTAVAVDYFNPNIVYIGLDTGDFYKSLDKGANWERINTFRSRVNQIILDKDDSRHLFVTTMQSYIYRSLDAGENWESLRENLSEYDDTARGIILTQDQQTGDLYYATGYGILLSNDKGDSWQEIKLLTVPSRTNVSAMALNPNNGNEIYYATDTNFYRSLDGGTTWSTWRLPTQRVGRALAVHPEDGNVLYLGMRLYEQK